MVDVRINYEGDHCFITVEGDVDASSSIYLDEALQQTFQSEATRIMVDCQSMNYISSAGLGVFMSYIQEAEKADKKLILFNMSQKVYKVFEILGLHQLLTIVDSQENAKIVSDDS